MATFKVFRGKILADGYEWYFHLKGDNGEIMLQSEGYSSEPNARRAIRRLKVSVLTARIK